MRYAAYLSSETQRLYEAHSANRFQARRSDCSFIFTRPVQTLLGELDVLRCYAGLGREWFRNCPIVLPR
jgi:hypothetical protein